MSTYVNLLFIDPKTMDLAVSVERQWSHYVDPSCEQDDVWAGISLRDREIQKVFDLQEWLQDPECDGCGTIIEARDLVSGLEQLDVFINRVVSNKGNGTPRFLIHSRDSVLLLNMLYAARFHLHKGCMIRLQYS